MLAAVYTCNEFNDKPAGGLQSLYDELKGDWHGEFNDEPEGDRVFLSLL